MYIVLSISQLPLMSPWSSKETVQINSPSSVDMMIILLTHAGFTMGQQRVVNFFTLLSLDQCLSTTAQNKE